MIKPNALVRYGYLVYVVRPSRFFKDNLYLQFGLAFYNDRMEILSPSFIEPRMVHTLHYSDPDFYTKASNILRPLSFIEGLRRNFQPLKELWQFCWSLRKRSKQCQSQSTATTSTSQQRLQALAVGVDRSALESTFLLIRKEYTVRWNLWGRLEECGKAVRRYHSKR